MAVDLKATATLAHQTNDAKGRPLAHPLTTLVVAGQLIPSQPIEHHVLAALLDESNPPSANVEFKMVNNVLTFSVTFEHDDDILAAGKANHDLAVEAANCIPPITVPQLIARKKAAAEAQAKAEAEAKAKAAEAKK